MKHLTKEFCTLELLSYVNSYVKRSKKAEQKDEDFYRHTYEKIYDVFENFSKSCDWYRDAEEESKKIEKYINEPNITDEERSRRIEFKKIHEQLHGNKNRTVYPFDKELCSKQFEERNRWLISLYNNLPQEILDKIADIRVFALGYASAEVKKLLRPYCADLRRTVRQIKEKARSETNEAESYLTNKLGLNEYNDCLLMGIEERDGDIYLKGEHDDYLLIKEGEIIEGKEKTVFPYNENIPNSPWSRIIATELHRIKDKFEVHFLVSNSDEIEREDLWYLTIRGADVSEHN